jgi:hypothetical protein
MKLIGQALLLLSLAIPYFSGTALAQTTAPIIKVNVPFEFEVGNKTFAAGDYSILRSGKYFLVLRNSRQQVVASVLTTPVQRLTAPATPKLEFYVEGGEHRLMQVWQANDHYGSELFRPKPANAMAKAQAGQVQTASGTRP